MVLVKIGKVYNAHMKSYNVKQVNKVGELGFFHVEDRPESSNVIVCFSSINVPAGKFNAKGALKDVDATIIYVNCPGNEWYLKGVPGLGFDIESTALALDTMVKSFTPSKVLYYGGSMGAYGALLCGAMNDADYVLASGLEVNLDKNGYFSRLCGNKTILVGRPDIHSVVKNSKSQVSLLFGELAVEDLFEIIGLGELKNVQLKSIPNCGHRVPVLLDNQIGIGSILYDFLEYGASSALNFLEGQLIQNKAVCDLICRARYGDADAILMREMLDICNRNLIFDGLVKSYLYYELASMYFDSGEITEALTLCRLCVVLNGNHYHAFLLLGKLYENSGNKDLALESFHRAVEVVSYFKTDSITFFQLELASSYCFFGEYSQCCELIEVIELNVFKGTPMSERLTKLKILVQKNQEHRAEVKNI